MPFSDLFLSFRLPLAVVPGLLGPLHLLMLVLPQILLSSVLAVKSLVNPFVWRHAAGGIWHAIRARPFKNAARLAVTAGGMWFAGWAMEPVEGSRPSNHTPIEKENWPTFHASASRCGTTIPSGSLFSSPPQPRWKFHDSLILERRPFASSPAIANSRVVIGGDNFALYCLDLPTGQLQWTFQARWPIFSSPAIWQDRVYVGEGLHEHKDSKFYCLDLANGNELWSFETRSHTESSPAVAEGKVYFGAGDDGVYCLDALTGDVIWHYRGVHVDSAPLLFDGGVCFGSGYGFKGVLRVSAEDGQLVWKRRFRAPVWGAPSFSKGRLYVAVGNGSFNESTPQPYGEVRCLDPETGRDLWRFKDVKDGVLTSVAVRDHYAVFGSRDGAAYALDAMTGVLLWRTEVEAPILSSPALVGDGVLFGADDGRFRCLRLYDGQEAWSFDTTGDMLFIMENSSIQSSPAVVDGKVVFGAANGNVYCLEPEKGGGAHLHTASSSPFRKTGPAPTVEPVVAASGYRSRLIWAADFLGVGLVELLARLTGSHGYAILLAALILKLLLLPMDWQSLGQIRKQRQLQPRIEHLRREYIDYRVHRYELRELRTSAGIHPTSALLSAVLQVPLFLLVFLVLQATPVFAGKSFIWIADLSAPDRAGQGVPLAWLGPNLNALPLVLAVSVWVYSGTLRPAGRRQGRFGCMAWPLVAIGVGLLTYRWPAALLLFTIALLWIGLFQHKLAPAFDVLAEGSGDDQ